MRTLIINAHPFPHDANAYSKKLEEAFKAEFAAKFDENELEILNLADEWIPRLDAAMMTIFAKQCQNEPLDESEQKIARRMTQLMAQFKRCKRVVIVTPIHNFNVTSQFKDYVDNIFIAGETFKYVTGGSVGLMTDGRKALLLQASGGIYTTGDRYTPMELTRIYAQGVFVEFMGFDALEIVRAQGTAVGAVDKEKMLQEALDEVRAKFAKFYE